LIWPIEYRSSPDKTWEALTSVLLIDGDLSELFQFPA
jgi:hypothetical protein